MRSSGVSRRSEAAAVVACLCFVAAASVWFFASRNYVLYYGDAQAHLNISRSIVDSLTPGYDQLGTVWLPVLHVICLPLVGYDALWSTGLAGSVPVALCFICAGGFLYFAVSDVFHKRAAAVAALACFALNPNVLYLGSIPMTEIVFLAELSCFVFCFVRYRSSQRLAFVAGAIAASWLMCLTRYDGWFLIPFEAVWFAAVSKKRPWAVLLIIGCAATVAPVYWMVHNWYWTGNALDFFNGPYSAKAIQGSHPYPGMHDWVLSARYYAAAARLCCGWGLVVMGIIGFAYAMLRADARWPAIFLLLTPLFYIWSLHSSATPIFVPQLYPHGYYNSRYGIATVLLFAFCAGAIADRLAIFGAKWAYVVPALSMLPWLIQPQPSAWICWKESEVNSTARRSWTAQAAAYFRDHYRAGEGILTDFGDATGIYCDARIPLRETLHVGNGPEWYATTDRPDLSHPTEWAIAPVGDVLYRDLVRSPGIYEPVFQISVRGAPAFQIFSRNLTGSANR